ncbi:MAG: M48 family metalloprotease [Pseudomonadota bacterium]
MLTRVRIVVVALVALVAGVEPARAQLSLIRDAEIETTIRDLSAPVFSAAGVNPSSVGIYLVNDDRLNAFVAGGQNLFLFTGLLLRSETPEQLAGVVAHETGHIAGGHLVRLSAAADRAAVEQILATVLGVAVAAIGAPEAGTAIIAGGNQFARQGVLSFNRGQEQAADQAAVSYLDTTGIGAKGLLEFFEFLDDQQLGGARLNPYLQTHPLTRDRMSFVQRHVRAQGDRPSRLPADAVERHERMVAKLSGFLERPDQVYRRYEGRDDFAARYARVVATYRSNDARAAIRELEPLLAQEPRNPYLHELKGQILFERGQVAEAIEPYRMAVSLAPNQPLIEFGYGRALLADGQDNAAVTALERVVRAEPRNSQAWRTLGIARGRAGDLGRSNLALAEAAILQGVAPDARLYLGRADDLIGGGGTDRQQYLDLLVALEDLEREQRR